MASVILDAGHGGYDNGASYEGRTEKEDNLNLVLAVGNILQNNGVDVLYTRTEDVYQSPTEKARIANQSGADYFVSIHRNAGARPNLYSGVQTLVFEDAGAPGIFAENIDNELAKTGYTNLGTEVRKNLAVLRRTTMPAVLVEAGFINTDQDNQIFDLKFPEIAQAIANGILLSLQDIENGIEATQETQDKYGIEVGVFRHEENARNLARILQKDGYDCYVEKRNDYYVVGHGDFPTLEEAHNEERKLYGDGYETRLVRK